MEIAPPCRGRLAPTPRTAAWEGQEAAVGRTCPGWGGTRTRARRIMSEEHVSGSMRTQGRRVGVVAVIDANYRSRWFRRYPGRPSRVRLVCLPHAGGTATLFHGWAERLPHDVEMLAVQYPGRQERFAEPCIEDMAELAARITEALEPELAEPLVLFGPASERPSPTRWPDASRHGMGACRAVSWCRGGERRTPSGAARFTCWTTNDSSPRRDASAIWGRPPTTTRISGRSCFRPCVVTTG